MKYIFLGLLISLLFGHYLTRASLDFLRCNFLRDIKEDHKFENYGILDSLFGSLERLFFTGIVAFDISGTAVAMMGWIAIKMASNWEFQLKEFASKQYVKLSEEEKKLKEKESLKMRGLLFCALLGNIISLSFAFVGGLFCRYGLKVSPLKLFFQ